MNWEHQDKFNDLIHTLGLRHFSPNELLKNCERDGNTYPPRALWHNIIPTIIVLDALRAETGSPINVSSAYRADVYNQRVGGVPGSQHHAFRAIDFKSDALSPAQLAQQLRDWNTTQRFRLPTGFDFDPTDVAGVQSEPLIIEADRLVFTGGVGEYPTFVHIDTRGFEAIWQG